MPCFETHATPLLLRSSNSTLQNGQDHVGLAFIIEHIPLRPFGIEGDSSGRHQYSPASMSVSTRIVRSGSLGSSEPFTRSLS